MNEEIDETEFYHQDFTTASEWEIFIAHLEEIINQWKTEDLKGEPTETASNDIWNIRTESLTFVDFDFKLSLHRKKIERKENEENTNINPFDNYYDFEIYNEKQVAEHSCLSRWYGINEFIVLAPAGNFGITSESRIKILLSSVYIVAANLKCEIPIFVQIREKWQQCYMGVYESDSIRTNLEMVHLKTCPRRCQYLSGLLELFKSKIVAPAMMPGIVVSLQSTYVLNDFGKYAWKQDYINTDSDNFDSTSICALPFGVTVDPIESIILKTTWSHLNHRAVQDSEIYSHFDPMTAPKWSILVSTTDRPICLLGECLGEILHLMSNTASVYDILGDFAASMAEISLQEPSTEPKVPTVSTLLTRAARNSLTKSRRGTAPIPEDILVPILYFLFPDADKDSPHGYKEPQPDSDEFLNLDEECRGFKTCPRDSLVWRLAIVLSHALQSLGGVRAFSHLWFEFVQEMRYRWENNIPIPGLQPGYPDLRTCLLHQKLQMLNCCIERKRARETATSESGSSDEEEFFDCADRPDEEERHSLWNRPVGRLHKFNDLKLLQTGASLYVPVTQEPVPKTEDQLEEDADVLLRLGADAAGSELRAKLMSASLLSDMESFKAANPGAVLEDFIRWYSPRDWLEETDLDRWGQRQGRLSARMLLEDNLWLRTWGAARPVPAARQRRLFDDAREAEKALRFLASRTPAEAAQLLSPALCHAALCRLAAECRALPPSADRWRALARVAERLSRGAGRLDAFVQEAAALELELAKAESLACKLGQREAAAAALAGECEVGGPASELGARLVAMFGEAAFPPPSEREFVLRVKLPRPASYSAECVQFLRAVVSGGEFRLAGAFSEDVVFF